jgi:hypothetical protein
VHPFLIRFLEIFIDDNVHRVVQVVVCYRCNSPDVVVDG